MPKPAPRGIRCNNPGNIERTSVKWRGMCADQSRDERFIVFQSPEWGIRAMARILMGDYEAGKNTLSAILNEYAPPSENNTAAYVEAVGRELGIDPYKPCNVPALLPKLIAAIIRHEQGVQPYDEATIQLGIDLERSA